MTLCDVEVSRIMPGSNGHHPSAERHIDALIFDNGGFYWAVNPLQSKFIAMLVAHVSLVLGVHHYILIAEFGLWPGGGDGEGAVLQVIQALHSLLVFDFKIGK